MKKNNKPVWLPLYMRKGNNIYMKTAYGSYIDINISDAIVQQHNAMSFEQLIKLGYK